MDRVSVSVIVPVYNVQDYLAKCIDSVLSQTYEDFELILVNDGSKDSSPQICDEYLKKDPRIKVIHKENGGLSSARNAGLDVAAGKYIYFLDSDDYIDPDLLEKTITLMEVGQYDWLSFGMIKEDLQGNQIENIAFKEMQLKIANEEERMQFLLKHLLNYRLGWEAWNHLYRGDIIRQNQLRFTSERVVLAEDMLFSFTYWLYANSCVVIPDRLYHYVQRSDSLLSQSKSCNLLPKIHELAQAACEAVAKANLPLIQRDFAMIYLHLLEWQTRPYVVEKGTAWVMEELGKLRYQQFWPEDRALRRQLYQDMMKCYGGIDGVVTVVLPVPAKEDLPRVEACAEKLLAQSLQKLDVLVLSQEEIQLNTQDIRVRWEQVDSLDAEVLVRTACEKGWGEYIHFADPGAELPVAFLERLGDALKYNACGAVILTEEPAAFVDRDSIYDRRKFRRFLCDHKITENQAMVRRDLLEESGIGCMDELPRYMADILLSNHILMMR